MRAVVNNTVLSNFANVRRADLVRQAFDDLVATAEVLAELKAGERLRRMPICDWSWITGIALTRAERTLMERLGRTVDAGEASCLAVAASRRLIFLTDDRDARRLAQLMTISISGTLGILQSSVDDGHLDLKGADDLLMKMMARGYRSPVRSLQELDPR